MNSVQIAQKINRFRQIHVGHPHELELFNTLDLMRALARVSPEGPFQGLKFVSGSYSGKSTSLRAYTARANRGVKNGPVLYVTLEGDTTPKALFVMIARALGDPLAEKGTYLDIQRRVYDACRERGIELIIIDEINHLVMQDTEKAAWKVTETLKRMLEDGVAPMVLAGMERAEKLFTTNDQLNNRLRQPFSYDPLDMNIDGDLAYAAKFMRQLDKAMVAACVCEMPSGLGEHALPWAIFKAGNGYIGRAKNIIERALELSLLESSPCIAISHLHKAVELWAVGLDFVPDNAFEQLANKKAAA